MAENIQVVRQSEKKRKKENGVNSNAKLILLNVLGQIHFWDLHKYPIILHSGCMLLLFCLKSDTKLSPILSHFPVFLKGKNMERVWDVARFVEHNVKKTGKLKQCKCLKTLRKLTKGFYHSSTSPKFFFKKNTPSLHFPVKFMFKKSAITAFHYFHTVFGNVHSSNHFQ